jgi:ABC-type antimicrobial peptide transport system permease subunit
MTTLRSILTVTIKRLLFGLLILLLIGYLSYFGLEMARSQDFSASLVQAADKTITYFGQLAQGDLGMTAANSL